METAFDFLTVACFAGLVIAYIKFAKRDSRTLAKSDAELPGAAARNP